MMPDRVFGNEGVQVVFQPGEGDTLVVSFNELTFTGAGTRFWGDEFFRKAGIPALGFVSTGPNWFPPAAVGAAVLSTRALASRFRTVVTYGHSMGGYAALKYSAALGARCALAFSPQWSIDPADVGDFDTRYAAHFDPALHAGMAIGAADLCPQPFVFFDPAVAVDRGQVERIPLGPARHVIVPCSGHETVRVLAEAGAVRALFERCAAPTVLATDLRQVARSARRRSATYARHLEAQWGQRLGQAAICRWTQAMQAGAIRAAIASIYHALAHGPDSAFLRLHAVQAWLACGERRRAADELDHAARLPDAGTVEDRIAAFRTALAAPP